MNIFVQSFDESNHKSEASSSSETSSSDPRVHSHEEEIILASARPKKRAGRRIFKETRHPVYRGVRRRNKNKWVCEVRVPNNKSRIWLGTYPTPEMAARAHDVAALTLRGKSTCLNFADSAWRLTLPASTDPEEIRRAAAEASELAFVQQPSVEAITDYNEVCSSTRVRERVKEDSDKNIVQEEGMYANEVPAVTSAFDDEDLHDWLVSMADEPLRSPTPFVRYGYSRDWNELEVDAEVSLWDFTI